MQAFLFIPTGRCAEACQHRHLLENGKQTYRIFTLSENIQTMFFTGISGI